MSWWEDIIKTDLNNRVGSRVLDSSGSEQEPEATSCEQGTERAGPIEGGEFLD
jgi:hypothetical protein